MGILRRRPGLGYIESPPDVRDVSFDALGLSAAAPSAASLEQHVGPIRDQGSTSTCVAQACAAAIDICESLAGLPVVPVSRLFIYFYSRAQHGAQRVDAGTYVRAAVKSLRNVGAPDEEFWPWSPGRWKRMHRQPGWEPNMRAHPRAGGRYYRIDGYGEDRVRAVKAAIDSGRPVVLGTRVAESFLDSDGPNVIDKPAEADKLVGGHAMVLVGYDANGFRLLNSWGSSWRDGGLCWITEDYLRWTFTYDLWSFEGWERIRAAAS